MEELRQANLDQQGVEVLQKLYNEVRAEEEKARENREKEREAAGGPEPAPRPSQAPETLKQGGLAHGIISRLLTTLRLMHEVTVLNVIMPLLLLDYASDHPIPFAGG